MAITRLFCCVLIQVLLITVYGEIEVNCRNQTGTVGKPLHLICNVKCDKNSSTTEYYWKIPIKKCTQCGVEKNVSSGMIRTFNYTIQNASKDHTGSFTFWVQMNTGSKKTIFNVNIVDPTTADSATKGNTEKLHKDEENNSSIETIKENNRSNAVAAVLVIVVVLAIIIMLALYRKRKNINMSITEQCTCQNITNQDLI
ncbi:uncharacterized protein LOC132862890 isoform X2 [Tachysurus vachellii]|uniref:uncharacterized protein LOC132862890 isoform X2 n=1 Tax=Tachysurus vachellii TaxID=175792 RepID=UPI00296B07B9|nr:uncharacterized protein LOC132862890 isoform X2 [Tachysurus vachellii]